MKEILLTSSVLIVVILLARLLFRGKVSQRLIYAAWLLVALRLLIPIQFGQSQYSITTLTEKIENNSKPIQQVQEAMDEPVASPSREELYDQLVNEYIQQSPTPDLPEIQESITPEVQEQIEEQVEQRINVPTLSELLTTIWIVGMSAMAAWFITANVIYLRRAKQGAVPLSEIDAPIPVRISPPCAHTLSGGLLPPGDLHDPCQRRKRTNKKPCPDPRIDASTSLGSCLGVNSLPVPVHLLV